MASVPKSYQATIKHGGGATTILPHNTHTDTIFQVPAGKTWQVIKMLVRVAPPTETKQVSLWRIEKASSSGVEQSVMLHEVPNQAWEPIEKSSEYAQFKDVVLEDQEIFKHIVKVHTSQALLLFQYEM
ncbi:MAG: hypothetical protein WB503_07580, partial [Pseudolabrys sp.]